MEQLDILKKQVATRKHSLWVTQVVNHKFEGTELYGRYTTRIQELENVLKMIEEIKNRPVPPNISKEDLLNQLSIYKAKMDLFDRLDESESVEKYKRLIGGLEKTLVTISEGNNNNSTKKGLELSRRLEFVYGQINQMKKYNHNFVAITGMIDDEIGQILKSEGYQVTFDKAAKERFNVDMYMVEWKNKNNMKKI
jgi:hypothetical protein